MRRVLCFVFVGALVAGSCGGSGTTDSVSSASSADADQAAPTTGDHGDSEDDSVWFPDRVGPWTELTSVDVGALSVSLLRADAESEGVCLETSFSEADVQLPIPAIPNCKAAAATVERFATVEMLGSPAQVSGVSVAIGYASAEVVAVTIVGASAAAVELVDGAWIAVWPETSGPVSVEIAGGGGTRSCDFGSDRGATVVELGACDLVFSQPLALP